MNAPESILTPSRVRRLTGLVEWTILGFLLGGVGPFLSMILLGAEPPLVAFTAGAMTVGVLGGIALGMLDLPRRFIARGPAPHRILSALLHGLAGGTLGAVWAGLAGAAGGALLVAVGDGLANMDPANMALFGGIGAAMGAVAGAPGVALFAGVRAALLAEEAPTWSAVLAATGLTLFLGPFGYLIGAGVGLAFVGVLLN